MIWRLSLAAYVVAAPVVAAAAPAGATPAMDAAGASSVEATTPRVLLEAPLFSEDFASAPVASVDGEVITLRQLTEAIASSHGSLGGEAKGGKKDFTPLLDRLIDARLLVLEAREMGLDELPEATAARDEFRAGLGQEILKARVSKAVAKDPADVDRLYKAAVREWKVRSILFVKEGTAKAFVKKVKDGKSFEELAKATVEADSKVKGGDAAGWFARRQALPDIADTLDAMKVGDTSPPMLVPDGWAVMHLEEIRYPAEENKAARAEAERASRARLEKAALKKYYDGLVKQYATVDRKLLKSLDFDAKKPGLEALSKDTRVLARIKGEKPITVGDLAQGVGRSFFHGTSVAAKGKKINREKDGVFDALLSARLVPLEVRRERIEETAEFQARFKDWEAQYLFSKFIDRAIIPSLKIDDTVLRRYYDAHRKEFTYPAFYKLESIAFTSVEAAQAAVDKLRSGTDFKWLRANADGQVKTSEVKERIEGTLSADSLPPELAAALGGASKGDCRLFAGSASQYHAVHVIDSVPSSEQPFEQAREGIQPRVFGEELMKAIKEWAAKVRTVRDVKVYIKRISS